MIRAQSAGAAQRSPPGPAHATIAPSGRPPSPPPLSAGLPEREAAIRSPGGASGPCPPRAAALGHGQPLLPRSAGYELLPELSRTCRRSARLPVALRARRAACHAGSFSRSGPRSAPSGSGYSIATATAPGREGGWPERASLPPWRGGDGAVAGGAGGGREVMHSAGFLQLHRPRLWRFV